MRSGREKIDVYQGMKTSRASQMANEAGRNGVKTMVGKRGFEDRSFVAIT